MSLPDLRRLARHVAPNLPSDRLARQWAAVDARTSQGPQGAGLARRWLTAGAVALTVAVAVGAATVRLHGRHEDAPGPFAGAVLESGERQSITLSDGAKVSLAPGSRVQLGAAREDKDDVWLQRGAVDLEVPHRPGHPLVVHAGVYDVVDVGTRFHVEVGILGRCTVTVDDGAVEVRRQDGSEAARRVSAGETWSSAPQPSRDEATARAPASTEETEPPGVSPPAPSPSASPIDAEPPSHPAPSPEMLLDAANRATLGGHPRPAAALLDRLRRRYRTDPRAPLAAFELGRLRLDNLADPMGAVEAFDDAIALAPSGSFREDAEARRVEAFDKARDPSCPAARDAYLARYPKGIHATMVAARCGGR